MIDRFSTFTVLVDKLKRTIRKIKTEEMAEEHPTSSPLEGSPLKE